MVTRASASSPPVLQLCFDDRGDALLSRDPWALLVGMPLDQHIPKHGVAWPFVQVRWLNRNEEASS